jgi:hypothetical protein
MYTLAPDEKKSLVMIYTHNSLLRGELVTKENVRVSIWLRMQSVPQYVHLLDANLLTFGGGTVRSLAYPELYYPSAQIVGFHLAPPAFDPLDYDPNEANRTMASVDVLLGSFVIKGHIRISTQADMGTSLEVARTAWMSVYDAEISNPSLPQMPALRVPMLLISPAHVSFGL